MTCTLYVAWDDRLAGCDFGPGHQEGRLPAPRAYALTARRRSPGWVYAFVC
jgi:hypothetical protein